MINWKHKAIGLICIITMVACAWIAADARREQSSILSPLPSIPPQKHTASVNGTGVDLAGYHAATVVIQTATVAASNSGTHTFNIQDSTNNSTWSDVTSQLLVGDEPIVSTTAASDTCYWVGYLGRNRYLRAQSVVSGTATSGAYYGAIVIRGIPRSAPTQ